MGPLSIHQIQEELRFARLANEVRDNQAEVELWEAKLKSKQEELEKMKDNK